MKRWQLIEIEDQPWCPQAVRNAVTDCLQFAVALTRAYAPVASLLIHALKTTGARQVLDLCSGGAGPWLWLQPALALAGIEVAVRLSDKFPNLEAFKRARHLSRGTITFELQSVDAASVPSRLGGFRTLFNSFHHFSPPEARAVLQDAVSRGCGIAVFEVTRRHPPTLLKMLLFPLAVLLFTPWIRPLRWSRLGWTYLLPAVPLVTLVDGLVSCLRSYTVEELRELIAPLDQADYCWEVGLARGRPLAPGITYLVGFPARHRGRH